MDFNVIFEMCLVTYVMITSLLLDSNRIEYTTDEKATLLSYDGNNFNAIDSKTVIGWNKNIPICFLIHGWQENNQTLWLSKLAQAYLNKQLCNVIIVDWGKRAAANYHTSLNNVRIVGNYVGEFLVDLINGGYPTNNIRLVGHSFGSHVAGFAGKFVYNKTNRRVDSITGLDPALPFFWFASPSDRLDKEDADFVSIIGTNRWIFGTFWNWGHVTFIANGGIFQPGCPFGYPLLRSDMCSHKYSILIQMNSIQDPHFYTAKPCNSRDSQKPVYISFNTSRVITGEYCFTT